MRSPLTAAMLFLLRLFRRKAGSARGVLLISARGPAEMVFLSAILPRFMRLARNGEPVTLLIRGDAGGMAFLFPRDLVVKRVDFNRLAQSPKYRWRVFRRLRFAHPRLAISLDVERDPDLDAALIQAADAPEVAAMTIDGRAVEDWATRPFPSGPARQDKIVRWSRFADFLSGAPHPPALALAPHQSLPEAMKFEIPTAVIFPFSAAQRRQLPADSWSAILDSLPADWQVHLAAHQADIDRNPDFAPLLRRPRLRLDTSGFDHLASKLRGARMVIGADTAGVHLSILLGAPTLCLASAAYVGAGIPYDEAIAAASAHFIYVPMECQGCLGACPFEPVRSMLPCVAAIEIETVRSAIADMVARGGY